MGMDYLIKGPVTLEVIANLIEKIKDNCDSGGHSVFIGQVRSDIINGKKVIAIEYSAYEGMVSAEAEKIKQTILSGFGDVKAVDIIHSTGLVRAGEFSLFVLVSAGHRYQAIQACSKTVELIKEKLPVWKKEIYDDNSHGWRENNPSQIGS